METIVLFLVASACVCAPTAFIRHALYHDTTPVEPWWFTPALLLLFALLLVLLAQVNVIAGITVPPPVAQILSVFVIAWGGWILLALRRG